MALKPLSTDVMKVEEAARRTGMHRDTIKKAIKAGTFPGHHPTEGVYVIPREWFGRWLRGEWTPEPAKHEEEERASA